MENRYTLFLEGKPPLKEPFLNRWHKIWGTIIKHGTETSSFKTTRNPRWSLVCDEVIQVQVNHGDISAWWLQLYPQIEKGRGRGAKRNSIFFPPEHYDFYKYLGKLWRKNLFRKVIHFGQATQNRPESSCIEKTLVFVKRKFETSCVLYNYLHI